MPLSTPLEPQNASVNESGKQEPPLSSIEILDEENWALSGLTPTADDLRLRTEYRKLRQLDADCADNTEIGCEYRAQVFAQLHASARNALCFSGGGIRSATFGLGVLQGLAVFSAKPAGARPKLLGEFDYLSTVSGGGYLGSWFSAWATRRSKLEAPLADSNIRLRDPGIPDLRDGTAEVIRKLASMTEEAFAPEQAPVKHLRAYSNYLSPRLGFLSFDTWALAATVLRNMLLNWMVLIPAFAAVLLIPVLSWRTLLLGPAEIDPSTLWALVVSGLLLGGWATAYVGFDLPSAGNAGRGTRHFLYYSLAPLSLSALALTLFWAWLPSGEPGAPWWDVVRLGKSGLTWWHFGVFGALMHGGGMLFGLEYVMFRFSRPPRRTGIVATSAAFGAGFVGGLVAWGVTYFADTNPIFGGMLQSPKLYACVAFPLLISVFLFSGTLLVGSTSYVTKDEDREWWARAGGWFLAICLGWLAFGTVTLYSLDAVRWLDDRTKLAFTAMTGISGYFASRGGYSVNTSAQNKPSQPSGTAGFAKRLITEYGTTIFMLLFILSLVMLLGRLNEVLLTNVFHVADGPDFWRVAGPVFCVALCYVALCSVASWFINVNKFSLHAMYRLRLIRAYLGASNPARNPHPFTGFDENDNISMCSLTANKPMHLVNMTLNLVHGSNLGWQERKAASFSSTRLHTGGLCVGYRTSNTYGGRYKEARDKTPISLGTAITISGAAASPNMGYHSSPLLSLVMTLFNARLGWWLGNPRCDEEIWKLPSPRWGIRPFVDEAFGLTTDTNSWIYLSDGGHFENLGIYEMVLRRCHCIVVSDAGCDPGFVYEDLANAIRKIRIDFGIPIGFDIPPMVVCSERGATQQYSAKHCFMGRIHYSAVDGPGAPDGILVCIKPSLNGNEPADVQNYAAANSLFPHQSTSDQFFSESQFESYRRLGLHAIEEILHAPDGNAYEYTLAEFVTAARQYAG
ncbi:MAG: patatin-like phospholipase family protein [Acidobacteriota bacterium]